MFKRLVLSYLTVFIALIMLVTSMSYAAHNEWAVADLAFARTAILANYPGVHNTEDSTFCGNLELFFQEAQQQLQVTVSDSECKGILRAFGKRFDDAHLSIYFPEGTVKNTDPRPREAFSSETATPDLFWVRIPFFMPQEQDLVAMQLIINTMSKLRDVPCIVFDLRGNCGGNSDWGKQIANALFGEPYAALRRAQALATEYMEVRMMPLPSGNSFLRLPIKVYRNRPRGHNVPYTPDILYAGDMKDTKAIQE